MGIVDRLFGLGYRCVASSKMDERCLTSYGLLNTESILGTGTEIAYNVRGGYIRIHNSPSHPL